MEIQWVPSPNYWSGRKGRRIIAIVNHITAGLMPGTLSWLCNPGARVSAHYLVAKNGRLYQMVKDENTAWHAGIVNKPTWSLYDGSNPNYYTIGIEHEALAGQSLTEAQYQATLELHRLLVQKHSITIDNNHIIGHCQLDTVTRQNDPGTGFPWDRLFKDLQPAFQSVNIRVGTEIMVGWVMNNVSFAPVRTLAEKLGRTVEWKGDLNAVFIPPVTAQVSAGQPGTVQIVTGNTIIPGILLDSRTYAPVRRLAEALGYKVTWDSQAQIVIIEKGS